MDLKTIKIENSIEELRAQLNSLVEENRQSEEVLNVSVDLDNLINQFYRTTSKTSSVVKGQLV